ncbi:MAG: thioredoxin-disulfide reductase [Dyadobacter sp.]
MTTETASCLIIGSGPAGYTAAIYASRAGLHPILYTGAQPGGQLTTTTDVDNYPGYPQGITGQQMMIDFGKQAERFGTDIRHGLITNVDFTGYPHKITVDERHIINAESVIISTGASAKWLGMDGEAHLNGRGVSACAICDGFFFKGQDVVVVGAGDTATQEASYLAKLCRKVYLLIRRDEMRASKIMQKRVETLRNIEILWNTDPIKLLGQEELDGVVIKNNKTGEVQTLSVTGFFVAIGHKPNTDIFKGYLDMTETGYIKTVPGSSCTNIKGVFACGDAQDNVYRQAVTAAGTGCMAALDAERFLVDHAVENIIEKLDI